MPVFLDSQDVYRIIQRELPPEEVYPDSGQPSAFFSTAESYATGRLIADYYAQLKSTYTNDYPISAVERLPDFEILYFGYTQDNSLSIDERRARLLSQIRTLRRTTEQDMLNIAYTVVDPSVLVEIAIAGDGSYGWVLDVSQLDINTYLNGVNGLELTGPNVCSEISSGTTGLPAWEVEALQDQAYTYYVLIYGYTLTAAQRTQLDNALSAGEPARSRHIILDGLDPADSIGGNT